METPGHSLVPFGYKFVSGRSGSALILNFYIATPEVIFSGERWRMPSPAEFSWF